MYCKVVKEPGALVLNEPGEDQKACQYRWVEGKIEELEEAGPLAAQHKKIKKMVKERAAQHDRYELLSTKNSVIATL